MTIRAGLRLIFLSFACLWTLSTAVAAQDVAGTSGDGKADLKFVVALSRHGVRSPIGNTDGLNKYSAAPWPKWDVKPSYLTPHGYELMKLVGAWDRVKFSGQGLFAAFGLRGCCAYRHSCRLR